MEEVRTNFVHQCQFQHGAIQVAKVRYLNYTICVPILNVNVKSKMLLLLDSFRLKDLGFKIDYKELSQALKLLGENSLKPAVNVADSFIGMAVGAKT